MALEAGLSPLGVPGVPWHTQILADQLILFETGGTDYAHQITTGNPDFQTFRRPCGVKILGFFITSNLKTKSLLTSTSNVLPYYLISRQ